MLFGYPPVTDSDAAGSAGTRNDVIAKGIRFGKVLCACVRACVVRERASERERKKERETGG